jgi:hypothetical protein
MLRKLVYSFFLIIITLNGQNTVGTISINENTYEAYTLFTIHTKTYLINNCGEVVNEWISSYPPGNAVYILPNGNLLRAGRTDDTTSTIDLGGKGGVIELFNWDSNLIWSYQYSTNEHRQHHDIYPLPNGNILMLALSVMQESEVIAAGRNPAFIPSNEIYNEQILELEPIGIDQANIVWEWNIKDHLIQDFDITKDNFGIIEDNPQLLDINFLNGFDGSNNWLHVNSMQYDYNLDQIVLSSRHLSEVWIIDHSTTTNEAASSSGGLYGKGGDFLYRWGNPQAYKQGTSADRKLFGQHYPHYIEPGLPNEGSIIAFNNGFDRDPDFSQVDILTPPTTNLGEYQYVPNTSYGPELTDYTYTDFTSNPSEFFSAILSSAQQLQNGNILICEGRDGYIFELDTNNNKVWEYINPINGVTGSTTAQTEAPSGNGLFRAIKYATDFSGFIGKDLTPGLPLEMNPNLTPCNNLSIKNFQSFIVSAHPNPTTDILEITSNTTIDRVDIYNLLGQRIETTNQTKINFSKRINGIYFLKIYSSHKTSTKKIIKH